MAFDEHALGAADHPARDLEGQLLDTLLQAHQPRGLDLGRRIVGHVCCRRARTGAEDEGKAGIEAHFVNELHGLLEVLLGFAGKTDDEIRRQRNIRARRAELFHQRLVFEHGIASLHRRQDAVGTGLHRQMQVRDQFRHRPVGIDQALIHFAGMRGRVANAFDGRHGGQRLDQQRQIGRVTRRRVLGQFTAVGIDVLAEQRDFFDALRRQRRHLGQHVSEGSRNFVAARVRHDAVSAEFGAAFHHRHIGRRPIDTATRQTVELLDLGERDVDFRLAAAAVAINQFGQPVQRLRPEDHIDIRRPRHDGVALLAGDAAADADQQPRPFPLELPDPAEFVEHLLLRLFTYRTSVEKDDVSFVGTVGEHRAVTFGEHVGDLAGIVLVHLATKGADEHLGQGCAAFTNGVGVMVRL